MNQIEVDFFRCSWLQQQGAKVISLGPQCEARLFVGHHQQLWVLKIHKKTAWSLGNSCDFVLISKSLTVFLSVTLRSMQQKLVMVRLMSTDGGFLRAWTLKIPCHEIMIR